MNREPTTQECSTAEPGGGRSNRSFRTWLRGRIEHDPRSLHAIEVAAGIPGNALGKFLRGERGRVHSLTPLTIQRLAPILRVAELDLLYRAGHLTHKPERQPLETSIIASETLDDESKLLMLALYARLRTLPAT
jgi:hypothetical protein